jgi:protein-S-isoprenylcysteine O-methyltransferase Ste14
MELVFDILVSFVGLASLGLAAWSARGHFSSERVPLGSVVITIVVFITVVFNIYLLWAHAQPLLPQAIGLAVMIAAIGLFFLTISASRNGRLRMAFDEGRPRALLQHGPYRYVRHPFYVAYIIFFAAFALSTWSAIAMGPTILLVLIYVLAARMEERLFAGTEMAAAYAAYRKRTGFFLPRLASLTPRQADESA